MVQEHLALQINAIFPVFDCNADAMVMMQAALEAAQQDRLGVAMTLLHEAGELLAPEPELCKTPDGKVMLCPLLTPIDPIAAAREVHEQRRKIIIACSEARFLISGAMARN